MAESLPVVKCPSCESEMEHGFLGTEQKGGGVLNGGLKCSKIVWSQDFRMGFFGKPKGENVSGKNTHRKYMAVPAMRCTQCRMILFQY